MQDNIVFSLKNFCGNTPDIIGGAVVSIDGLIIASYISGQFDEDLIGGMTASMLGIGERISVELMSSEMDQVYVRSPNGYVMVNAIGQEATLLVLVSKQAKLGLVFLEAQRAVQELEKYF